MSHSAATTAMACTVAIGSGCTACGSAAVITNAGFLNVNGTTTVDGASTLAGTVTAGCPKPLTGTIKTG